MTASQDFTIEVTGHDWAVDLLKQQHAVDRVPQSLLLTGPANVGKSTVGRYFAQYLNCSGSSRPCGECSSCRKLVTGNHPDIRILDDEDNLLKIDQIRTLQRELSLSPVEGRYRVALLCNFDKTTVNAANALLKTLEEPASHVVLVLTASEPGSLLPTIVSRCQILKLRPVPKADMLESLQTRWQANPEQAELLTQLAGGRLGWAVSALTDENFLIHRAERFNDMLDLLQMHRAERLAYAAQMSRDVAALREMLLLWLGIWRDLLLLQSGTQTDILNLDWRPVLEQIASHSNLAQAGAMVKRLQKAYLNLNYNVNPRLNLEIVLLKLPHFAEI